MEPNNLTTEDGTVLDPKVLKVVRAIRQVESGGDYNAVGDNGESHGAYQWNKDNFKNAAREILKDENAPMTPANQNKVAYHQVKAYKDAGRDPEEIAALWNGAKKDKATGRYVYNNPEYGDKFRKAISGQTVNPNASSTPIKPQAEREKESLGTELQHRGSDIATGISSLVGGKEATGQNRLSGLLQTAGGIAGGIGDVVNKGIELIPGVKQVEGLIGKGVGKLVETETGQKFVGGIQKFSEEHPELSKDIGAVMNIATAIPILKGVGTVGRVALDAGSMALKGVAEKAAVKDFTEAISRTITGRKILAKDGGDSIQTLIKERAIPDIIDNKYNTKEAWSKLSEQISSIEDNKLQPALAEASSKNGIQTSFVPLKQVEQEAIKIAEDELKDTGPINKYFELLKKKYGETPSIQQLNEAKRKVSKNITEAGFNSPTYNTDKIVRSSLQKAVEDGAKALGRPDIDTINQEMAQLIKAQNILKQLEGKAIKSGMVGNVIKTATTVGGEMAGEATGVPIAGTLAGRSLGSNLGKKLTGGVEGILKRTGKDAQRVTREELQKGLGKLFRGQAYNRTTKGLLGP